MSRQLISNQHGRPGRAARDWGHSLEGNLSEEELTANRNIQPGEEVEEEKAVLDAFLKGNDIGDRGIRVKPPAVYIRHRQCIPGVSNPFGKLATFPHKGVLQYDAKT
ncbi:hypothetical protein DER45DRAFT_545000 [Fusarium avenaceum]|nr:hypothetical protein DER45DRAFT_545000 [Fusarium avenaceum]